MTSARLRIRYADGRIADRILREGTYVIGRESGDIMLLDPNVSGKHAELVVKPAAVVIQDCGSTNGTWDATGARITGPRTLIPNQAVRLGNCHIVLAEAPAHITTLPPSSDDPSPLTTDTPLSPYRLPDVWRQRGRRKERH